MERPTGVSVYSSPPTPEYNNMSSSTLAFDQHFTSTAKGMLLLVETVCGMLVWILVGGTDYFHLSALCWVMFVAVLFWILTVCLFITYLTGLHHRIPHVPWTTLSLCLNCSATVLYLVAAALNALTVSQANRGRHSYKCWAASTCFAFLTTLCYAGSSFLSYHIWKTKEEEQ
ncbi:CKLF-like MARVEL transmembrane domain-containing protein 8b [Gouania willdenowi]|uniref:MARVEL domain-containing protein n=1 Tax=Gouania willdenowi TaxID=441366 RepID=A0A8C5DL52_GOUWI|nr:CKLF-like MARVEL transmembrane domain-containing protein 8 [Gouania willdenowi]